MAKILEYISLNYTWFLVGAIIIVLAIIGHYAEKTNFGQSKSNNTSTEDEDKKIELEKVTLTDLINKDNKNSKNNGLENINAQEIFNENSLEDIPSNINDSIDNNVQNDPVQQEQTGINNFFQEDLNQFDNNLPNQTSISSNMTNSEIVSSDLNNNNINNDDIQEIDNDLFSNVESVQPIVTESDSIDTINNNIEKSDISTDKVSDENQSVNDVDLPKPTEKKFANFDEQFDAVIPKKEVINEEFIENIDDLSLEQTQVFNTEDVPELDDIDIPEIRDTNISDNDIWKF